jgi:IS30 family transposase
MYHFVKKRCDAFQINIWSADVISKEEFTVIHALKNRGCSIRAIARTVGLNRGSVHPYIATTIKREKLQLNAHASMKIHKPTYIETEIDDGVEINIKARDMKEVKNMLKGVKGKYPNLNIKESLWIVHK